MDGHAGNVTTANLHFTNVDTGTDLDSERVHHGDNRCCTVDRDTRAAEDRQKSVADGVNFTAAEALELLANDAVVVKRAVVSGAGYIPERAGHGWFTSLALAEAGASVACIDIDKQRANRIVGEIVGREVMPSRSSPI